MWESYLLGTNSFEIKITENRKSIYSFFKLHGHGGNGHESGAGDESQQQDSETIKQDYLRRKVSSIIP
jgi:hypothetical protein